MTEHRIFALTLIALATLAGCSSQPAKNALLDQARSDYQTAQNTPQARDFAGGEMKQADDALKLANAASERGDKPADVDHLAYLAKQRIAIAQETGRQKAAEKSVDKAEASRDKVRLAARTTEADNARQDSNDAKAKNRALEAELKALNAKPTPRGMVITVGDVLFDTDRAEIRSGGRRNMEKLAAFLKANPERKAMIEGFTDSTGSDVHNRELSGRRADAVMGALVEMGIGSSRLSAHGYGEAYPVAGNGSIGGRQMNRRVEVVLSDENGNIPAR
jgi:outer membrane protein OmpA-like peptidoglycan-associated protein